MVITFTEGLATTKDVAQIMFFVATPTIAYIGLRGWQREKEFDALLEATARLKELHEAIKQCRSPEFYGNNDVAEARNLDQYHLTLMHHEVIQQFDRVKRAMMRFRHGFIKTEVFINRRKIYKEGKRAIQNLEVLCRRLQVSIQYYFSQRNIGISIFECELEKHRAIVFQLEKYGQIHINPEFEEIDYGNFQKELDICIDKINDLLKPK